MDYIKLLEICNYCTNELENYEEGGGGGWGLSIVSMKQDVLDIQNNADGVYFDTNNVLRLLHAFKNRILILILYQDKSYFVKKV